MSTPSPRVHHFAHPTGVTVYAVVAFADPETNTPEAWEVVSVREDERELSDEELCVLAECDDAETARVYLLGQAQDYEARALADIAASKNAQWFNDAAAMF